MQSRLAARSFGGFVAFLYFGTNVVFASAPESSFWAERRKNAQRQNGAAPVELASLPAASSFPADILRQLPSLDRVSQSAALSQSVAENLPRGFVQKHADLLKALPYSFGTVRRIAIPDGKDSGRVVIHIQDVHQNEEAQKNIGQAVETLVDKDQVGLVGLEGAFEPINLSGFRAFSQMDAVNKGVLDKVADYLLRQGEISGPIHSALTGPKEFPLITGIDDPAHYEANVGAYRRSAPLIKEYKEKLSALRADLGGRESSVFNPALLAFDRQAQSYHAEKTPLGDFVKYLAAAAPLSASGSALRTFQEALAMESALDFKRVESERAQMVEKLVQKLDKDRINSLIQWSVAYRAGQLRYADFYKALQELCRDNGVDLKGYPAMAGYIRYVLLADRIDAEQLFTDLLAVEKAAYERLAVTPEEKRLVEESRGLSLAGKLVDFSLTPPEWADYHRLSPSPTGPLGRVGEGWGDGGSLDLSSFEAFYQEAQARDEAMTARLLKAMKGSDGDKAAVLVTGGYHSSGMMDRLRRAGVTVISFTPKIEKIDTAQGSAYLSVFTREKTPLENLFKGQKLFLASGPAHGLNTNRVAPEITAAAADSAARERGAVAEWDKGELGKLVEKNISRIVEEFKYAVRTRLHEKKDVFDFTHEIQYVRMEGDNIEVAINFKSAGRPFHVRFKAKFNAQGFLEVSEYEERTAAEAARGFLQPLAAPAARTAAEALKASRRLVEGGVPEFVAETAEGVFRAGSEGQVLTDHEITSLPKLLSLAIEQRMLKFVADELDDKISTLAPGLRNLLPTGISQNLARKALRRPFELLFHWAINETEVPAELAVVHQAAALPAGRSADGRIKREEELLTKAKIIAFEEEHASSSPFSIEGSYSISLVFSFGGLLASLGWVLFETNILPPDVTNGVRIAFMIVVGLVTFFSLRPIQKRLREGQLTKYFLEAERNGYRQFFEELSHNSLIGSSARESLNRLAKRTSSLVFSGTPKKAMDSLQFRFSVYRGLNRLIGRPILSFEQWSREVMSQELHWVKIEGVPLPFDSWFQEFLRKNHSSEQKEAEASGSQSGFPSLEEWSRVNRDRMLFLAWVRLVFAPDREGNAMIFRSVDELVRRHPKGNEIELREGIGQIRRHALIGAVFGFLTGLILDLVTTYAIAQYSPLVGFFAHFPALSVARHLLLIVGATYLEALKFQTNAHAIWNYTRDTPLIFGLGSANADDVLREVHETTTLFQQSGVAPATITRTFMGGQPFDPVHHDKALLGKRLAVLKKVRKIRDPKQAIRVYEAIAEEWRGIEVNKALAEDLDVMTNVHPDLDVSWLISSLYATAALVLARTRNGNSFYRTAQETMTTIDRIMGRLPHSQSVTPPELLINHLDSLIRKIESFRDGEVPELPDLNLGSFLHFQTGNSRITGFDLNGAHMWPAEFRPYEVLIEMSYRETTQPPGDPLTQTLAELERLKSEIIRHSAFIRVGSQTPPGLIEVHTIPNQLILSDKLRGMAGRGADGRMTLEGAGPISRFLVDFSDVASVEVELVAGPSRETPKDMWETPEAVTALHLLLGGARGAASLVESGKMGTAGDPKGHDIGTTKRFLDGIATRAFENALGENPFVTEIRAGEGEVPKANEGGKASPGLYVGRKYGRGDGKKPVHVAIDPIDGTGSAAQGPDKKPEPPTLLATTFGAGENSWRENKAGCRGVMGPKDVPVKPSELWNHGAVEKAAVVDYLQRVANHYGRDVTTLRVATRGDQALLGILRDMGVQIVEPSTMLEQLYMVPSSVDLGSGAKQGAVDVLLGGGMGVPEMVVCAITLAALGRDKSLSFSRDGVEHINVNDVVDPDIPAWSNITAARAAETYLGLEGPKVEEAGRMKTQSLVVSPDGSVRKVTVILKRPSLSTHPGEEAVVELGKEAFTLLARAAGLAPDEIGERKLHPRRAFRHQFTEEERLKEAVEGLRRAASAEEGTTPHEEGIREFEDSMRGTSRSLAVDFRNVSAPIGVLCDGMNARAESSARPLGAGWGGMMAVWTDRSHLEETMERLRALISSEEYREALGRAGVEETAKETSVQKALDSLQILRPGPASGVLFDGDPAALIRAFEREDSPEATTLRRIYGDTPFPFHGQSLPSWRVARERYLTLLREFESRYPESRRVCLARGASKVSVAGSHTDHGHGGTLKMALLMDTLVAMSESAGDRPVVRLASMNPETFPDSEMDLAQWEPVAVDSKALAGREWGRFSTNTLHFVADRLDVPSRGMNILVDGRPEYGAIPIGVGMGSSAALEVASALAYLRLTGQSLGVGEIAGAAVKAEAAASFHTGLDDALASMGSSENASSDQPTGLLLRFIPQTDKAGNAFIPSETVPIPGDLRVVMVNTGPRSPTYQSEYKTRLAEAYMASYFLSRSLSRRNPSLRTASVERLAEEGHTLKPGHSDIFPPYYKYIYFEPEMLSRLGVQVQRDEVEQLVEALPEDEDRREIERELGEALSEELSEMGGDSAVNRDLLFSRLAAGASIPRKAETSVLVPSGSRQPVETARSTTLGPVMKMFLGWRVALPMLFGGVAAYFVMDSWMARAVIWLLLPVIGFTWSYFGASVNGLASHDEYDKLNKYPDNSERSVHEWVMSHPAGLFFGQIKKGNPKYDALRRIGWSYLEAQNKAESAARLAGRSKDEAITAGRLAHERAHTDQNRFYYKGKLAGLNLRVLAPLERVSASLFGPTVDGLRRTAAAAAVAARTTTRSGELKEPEATQHERIGRPSSPSAVSSLEGDFEHDLLTALPPVLRDQLGTLDGLHAEDVVRHAVANMGHPAMDQEAKEALARLLHRRFGKDYSAQTQPALNDLRLYLNRGTVNPSAIAEVHFDAYAQKDPAAMVRAATAALALNPGRVRFVLQTDAALPKGFEELLQGRDNADVKVDPDAFDDQNKTMRWNVVAKDVSDFAYVTLFLPDDYSNQGAPENWTVQKLKTLADFFQHLEEIAKLIAEQA